MAEVKWTKEQEQAIYSKGRNILVAAAAGSGKTAVLVERIINKVVNENVDIDKILVVTFTNAAASEMKERVLEAIYKKIDNDMDNLNLQRQINLLNKANICTIDSFCLDVVRNNFFELENINPNFRIADNAEMELLKIEVLEEIFEQKYEEYEEDFIDLIKTYTSYKDDSSLKELIFNIYNYISSMPFPEKWLKEALGKFNIEKDVDFSSTIWGQELLETVKNELIDQIKTMELSINMLESCEELEVCKQCVLIDKYKLEELYANTDKWDKAYEIYTNIKFEKWPKAKASEEKEEAKKIRDAVKKKVEAGELSKIFTSDSKEAVEDILKMREILLKFEKIILEFSKEFSKKKQEKNVVDFSDIEHYALKILVTEDENGNPVPSSIAKQYQEKFNEIAIDEYQDSNYVQESILTSVSKGNNIFMVGDVKQSIYKFRHAVPGLFIDKYLSYKKEEELEENDESGMIIQLFNNFRSRENVLGFTNLIFENIMSKKLGDIDYTEEEYLNLGAKYLETEQDLKTEINVIDLFEDKDKPKDDEDENNEIIEKLELEGAFVAKRIKELLDEKFQVYDKKIDGFRDIKYKDIVVLLRSTKNVANVFEKAMIDKEIPVYLENSLEYLETIEIQTIMHLLKIIDNPIQDIPLVSVMRSSIGGFTDNELVEIRLNLKKDTYYNAILKARINSENKLKEKIDKFLDNLEKWREDKEYLALDEFIWKIYSDTGFYNFVGLLANGEQRQANLKMLFEKAKQYENASFKGLYNFITFMERVKVNKGDFSSAKIIGENEDVVRIMSIHKSKGLEFPVVFLSNTSKQFNMEDLKNEILLHQDLGIGMQYIDYMKQIKYTTLTKKAIQRRMKKEAKGEEMRVLYVALTRAKEKLIITGTSKNYETEKQNIEDLVNMYVKEDNKINSVLVGKYQTYLEYILLTSIYEYQKIEELMNINIIKKEEVLKYMKDKQEDEEDDFNIIECLEKIEFTEEEKELIEKNLKHNYSNNIDTILPTKTSVTEIKKMKLNKEKETKEKKAGTENEEDKKEIEFEVPKFIEEKEEKITAAKKGTLIHLCIERLDISKEYTIKDIGMLIEELASKKIIDEKEKQAINLNKILAFTKSKIWNELKEAKKIYKEKPFYINHTAEAFVKDDIEEQNENRNILVQGVIDLYYIDKNDELVLVDYKSDYVENGEEDNLVSKYKEQLDMYQLALEEALDKKVLKKYIYSTYLEKEIVV